MSERDSWQGTPSELLALIGSRKEGIPKDAIRLSTEVMKPQVTDALWLHGITVQRIGTPEECRERMAEYFSVVDWVALSTPQGGMPSSENAPAVHRLIQSFGG